MLEILLGSKTPLTVLAYGSHRVQVLLINVKVRDKLLHILYADPNYITCPCLQWRRDKTCCTRKREHFKFSLNKEF